jgi:rubrerythrin
MWLTGATRKAMIKEKLVEMLIKSAMSFEDETYRFYVRCMEEESDPRISGLFEKLAEEELVHKARLESILTTDLENILSAEEPDLPEEIDLPEVVKKGIPPAQDKAVDVLATALEHEISSRNFYVLLSKRSALSVLKKTFRFLASQEERHIEQIRSILGELQD